MTAPPKELEDLAPADLAMRRNDRYDGGGFGVSLRRFTPEDVAAIYRVYETIKGMYSIWLYARQNEQDPLGYDLYRRFLERIGSAEFVRALQGIGNSTIESAPDRDDLRRIVHDLRGGGMAGLVGHAGLLELEPHNREFLRAAIFLARDHAKMMRNALTDLDEDVRNADETALVHRIDGFVEKWHGTRIDLAERSCRVEVDNRYDGAISNRCLETSAIDRVLYNLVNNAARFAADGVVRLWIFPVSATLVRWVVDNRLTADHAAWLRRHVGDDVGRLYAGGITRGGEGVGLSNCGEIVQRCFGLPSASAAVERGYLGARLHEARYLAWFHWPAFRPDAGARACDCREGAAP